MLYILIVMTLFSFNNSWCAAQESAPLDVARQPSAGKAGFMKRDDSWPSFDRPEEKAPDSWPALPSTPVGTAEDTSMFAEPANPVDGMPTISDAKKKLATTLKAAAHRRSPTQSSRH